MSANQYSIKIRFSQIFFLILPGKLVLIKCVTYGWQNHLLLYILLANDELKEKFSEKNPLHSGMLNTIFSIGFLF